MRYITMWTREYAPWRDDQDEPTLISMDSDTLTCEPDAFEREQGSTAVDVAADILAREGVTRGRWCDYSSTEWAPYGWYAVESYTHPGTGETTERTLHLHGFTEGESRQLYSIMTTSALAGAA